MERMKKKLLVSLLIGLLFLAGCNSSATTGEKEPSKIHNVFLMYEEEYVNDSYESIGDLFFVAEGKEKEKIASEVINGEYYYDNSKNKVFFLDEERNLYEYESGKEKEKLAEEVLMFSGDTEIITFLNSDYALYVLNEKNEKDKVASSINSFDVIGKQIYYLDDDGDLSKYSIKDKQETEIENDVVSFTKLSDDEEIAFLDEDYSLYYQKGDQESFRITGDEVSPYFIKKVGNSIVYYNNEDDESLDLYVAELKEDGKNTKIASDVYYYQYDDGYYYYLNSDDNLYKKKANEDDSTKIKSDVSDFTVANGTVYYLNVDNDLYKLDGKESEKIKSSISSYQTTLDGDIVYVTDDQDMYVNSEKVASEIEYYSLYFDNLAYSHEDKLYLMENLGKKKTIVEDLNQYSSVSYHNEVVFKNELTFDDIAGVWKAEEDGESAFIEIRDNGEVEYLQTAEIDELEVNYAGYNSLDTMTIEDGYYVEFVRLEDGTMDVTSDGITLNFTKSSLEEAEEYYITVQLEEDKLDVEYLVSGYVEDFEYAVYWGDEWYLEGYLDPNSPIYQEKLDYITSSYEVDAWLELSDYQVKNIQHVKDAIFTVETVETYYIYNPENDFTGAEQTKNNTYTVERIDGEFFIVDIQETSADSI